MGNPDRHPIFDSISFDKVIMGAKHKLNSAYFSGALGVAALIGAVTGSWGVFSLAAGVLVASSIHSGDIRLGRGGR